MGTPKFIAIATDPYKNESDLFIFILATDSGLSHLQPAEGQTLASTKVTLSDPAGNSYPMDQIVTSTVLGTDATAYPYVLNLSGSYSYTRILLVPPNWTLAGHGFAMGLIGSLEDLRGYL